MNFATRFSLLGVALAISSIASGEEPKDPIDEPLPQTPKLRFGTTRYRNIWSDTSFALSPDGRTLAVTTESRELAFVDSASGKLVRRVRTPDIHHGRVEYLPGGKLLKVETYDGVSVVDLETGQPFSAVRFENF